MQNNVEAIPATEYWRIPDYLDEIVYDYEALKSGKSLKDSLILLSWENIYPADDIDLSDFVEE